MKKDEEAEPRIVCCANQDFNVAPHRAFLVGNIPLLKFSKNEMVVMTKLPNKVDWCEGYVLYQKKIRLGIFPCSFVSQVKMRLE